MENGFAPHAYEHLDWFAKHYKEVEYRHNTEVLVRCPDPEGKHKNGDANPSLSIGLSQNGKGPTLLVNCLSQGCCTEAILKARGLDLKDLYPNGTRTSEKKSEGPALRG